MFVLLNESYCVWYKQQTVAINAPIRGPLLPVKMSSFQLVSSCWSHLKSFQVVGGPLTQWFFGGLFSLCPQMFWWCVYITLGAPSPFLLLGQALDPQPEMLCLFLKVVVVVVTSVRRPEESTHSRLPTSVPYCGKVSFTLFLYLFHEKPSFPFTA